MNYNYDNRNVFFFVLDVFTQISGTNGLLVVSKLDIYLRDLLQVSATFLSCSKSIIKIIELEVGLAHN